MAAALNQNVSLREPRPSLQPCSLEFFAQHIRLPEVAQRFHDVFHEVFNELAPQYESTRRVPVSREDQLKKIELPVKVFCKQVRCEAADRDFSSEEKINTFVYRSLFKKTNIATLLLHQDKFAISIALALVALRKAKLDTYEERRPVSEIDRSSVFTQKIPPGADQRWTFVSSSHPECALWVYHLVSILEGTGFEKRYIFEKMEENLKGSAETYEGLCRAVIFLKKHELISRENLDALFAAMESVEEKAISIYELEEGKPFMEELKERGLSFVAPHISRECKKTLSQPSNQGEAEVLLHALEQTKGTKRLTFINQELIKKVVGNFLENSPLFSKTKDQTRTVTEADLPSASAVPAKRARRATRPFTF